jgi:hypothetical protein
VRLKLIACEILCREFSAAVARSVNHVDPEFLPKGLHDIGSAGMSGRLQEAIDRVEGSHYDAVALGYALCSNGLIGLRANDLPIVVPRAHDCITLLLGDGDRYLDYFRRNPGTYFKTSGWIERGDGVDQSNPESLAHRSGISQSFEELAAKYGEDNARFLRETLGNPDRRYQRMTFIEMGIEPDDRFELQTRREAARRGWMFEKLQGDMALMQGLLDGPWDERRYLTVPPRCRIARCYSDAIVKFEPES